jgi:hypothetical protein
LGVAIITTSSTEPMSMPSSRLVEQITRPQFAALQTVFDIAPHLALERGVMTFDHVREIGKIFAQPEGRRLSAGSRVAEDERRAVFSG